MAFDRRTFKTKITAPLKGAIREFYKSRLATKNDLPEWVAHWDDEVVTLLIVFVTALTHEITGFSDRSKALHEVIKSLKNQDARLRRAAEGIIQKDHGLRKLTRHLDASDTEEFWARVKDLAAQNGVSIEG